MSKNESKSGRPASTTIFRVLNFELFVKPNKYVMAIGGTAMVGCLAYLVYLKYSVEEIKKSGQKYIAVDEEGREVFRQRKSKWE